MSFTKTFKSFEDALNFRRNCPFCNHKMIPTLSTGLKYQSISEENDEIIFVDNSPGTSVTVNCTLNKITSVKIDNNEPFGLYYTGIKISCDNCPDYSYFIKLLLNLTNKNIQEISLNSETIRWFQNDVSYKFFISYSFANIEFTKMIAGIYQNKLTIPIVTVDITDREKMLETMKTYATFI